MLLLVLVLTFLVVFALFWGGTLVAQGYLYQNPAGQLPLRAAVGALLVALFLTFWVWLDKNSPGKYDTFFEFAPYSTTTFTEYEAVRWQADPVSKGMRKDAQGKFVETTTKYKRAPGGKAVFVEEGGGNKAFALSDGDTMTAALVVKPDPAGEPKRFNAVLKKDERTGAMTYLPKGNDQRRFAEEGGSRYVMLDQPGVLYVPSTAVVVLALLLNFALFVVWFAALWPVLRFSWGHALGLAVVLGLVTMLLVMPLLFKPNRQGKAPPEAAQVPGRSETMA